MGLSLFSSLMGRERMQEHCVPVDQTGDKAMGPRKPDHPDETPDTTPELPPEEPPDNPQELPPDHGVPNPEPGPQTPEVMRDG